MVRHHFTLATFFAPEYKFYKTISFHHNINVDLILFRFEQLCYFLVGTDLFYQKDMQGVIGHFKNYTKNEIRVV